MTSRRRTTATPKLTQATARLKSEIALNRDFTGLPETAFLALVWTWKRLDRMGRTFFQQHGVTDAQFNALMILSDYGQPLKQHELADLLVVGRASAGGVVERMDRNGWIRRAPDPDDRRALCVTLTRAGIAKLEEIRGPYYELLGAIFGDCDADELGSHVLLFDSLRRRLARLEPAIGAGSGNDEPATTEAGE